MRVSWIALGLAVVFAVVLAVVVTGCVRTRPALVWVADRGADELVMLDGELCLRARVPLVSPRFLSADGTGVWVAAARSRAAPAPERLLRLDARTGAGRATGFAALVALCAEESGCVLVLERCAPRETLLWRVDARLRRTLLGSFPAAQALCTRSGEILVGCARGELVRLAPHGAVLAMGTWAGAVLALARGPRAGEWWVLGEGGVLGLLGAELEPLWAVETGLSTSGFAAVPGEERVWLAAREEARRYGPSGALELSLELAGGPWCAAEACGERVLFRGVGALLELVARGNRARVAHTQGGFGALAALASFEGALPAERTALSAADSVRHARRVTPADESSVRGRDDTPR